MNTKPKTVEEARILEIEAIARVHARELTAELRERGVLGPDEEVVWEWSDPKSEEPPE